MPRHLRNVRRNETAWTVIVSGSSSTSPRSCSHRPAASRCSPAQVPASSRRFSYRCRSSAIHSSSAIARILYPLARLDEGHPRYAALLVDTNSARIFVFGTGATIDTVDVQNPKTKHSKAGGWSQARFQRHVENVHLHHAKEVVERLDQIVAADDIEHVVIAGDEVIVPLLKEQLPERLSAQARRRRCVSIFDCPSTRCSPRTLEALRKKDEETDETVVQDLIGDYRAGGLALVGVAARARRAGARAGRYAGDRRRTAHVPGARMPRTTGDAGETDVGVGAVHREPASARRRRRRRCVAPFRWPEQRTPVDGPTRRPIMSRRINVNPDHYKVAGRERQGENFVS